jgi:hypothetical protein
LDLADCLDEVPGTVLVIHPTWPSINLAERDGAKGVAEFIVIDQIERRSAN